MSNRIWLWVGISALLACLGCGGAGGYGGGGNTPTPIASLSPGGLTFPAQNIDNASATMPATLSNSGTASLSIANISASGDFTETNNCPATLAAAANCTIQVTFTPTAAGTRTGTLTVADSYSTGSQTVGLTGTGANSAAFFVSPSGKDTWSGTLAAPNSGGTDGPFKTFHQARITVQSLNKTGLAQIVVQFRAGTYFLQGTENFTSADSGTGAMEITYENFPGEKPVISGGMRVTNWTNTSGNIWKTTLSPTSTAPFENLFYNGVRRLRPRLGSGGVGTYLRIASTYYAAAQDANCPVQDATLLPGNSWECFDRFYYASGDPVSSAWKNLAAPTSPANPNCDAANGSTAPPGDIELLDFEQFTVSKLRIGCVDTTNKVVYMTAAMKVPTKPGQAGFITGHRYLVENVQDALTQPGQWFLDRSTNPWTLTYLANNGENPNTDTVIVPQLPQVLVASGLQYVTFQGLAFLHDNFAVLPTGYDSGDLDENITAAVSLQSSQNIVLDSDTIAQTSGAGLEIIVCGLNASPSWCAPSSTPSVTGHITVQNSAFYDLGGQGIHIGMPQKPLDSDTNLPQFITVQNTVVEGWGRVFPSTFGMAQGMGHDNLFTHNDVYDGYDVGISICVCGSAATNSSGPANNTISFNHVHHTHQGIMNDGGAVRIAAGNGMFTASGNKILNNKVHDVSSASSLDGTNNDPTCIPSPTLPCDGYGGDGIYLDDQSGLIDVENNLVYRVSENAVNFPITPPAPNEANTIKNNILAFARGSMINDSSPYPNPLSDVPNQTFVATNNLMYFDRNVASPSVPFYVQGGCTWDGGSAFTYSQYQQWDSNMYYRADGSFAGDTQAFHVQSVVGNTQFCTGNTKKWTFLPFACTLAQPVCWQSQGEDAHGKVQDPGFKNPSYPNDDFSLPGGSPGVGFVVFDATLAGRSNPVISPPAVPATFPVKPFDPAADF